MRGKRGKAYNVGSDQPISIKELARKIDKLAGRLKEFELRAPTSTEYQLTGIFRVLKRLAENWGCDPLSLSKTRLGRRLIGTDLCFTVDALGGALTDLDLKRAMLRIRTPQGPEKRVSVNVRFINQEFSSEYGGHRHGRNIWEPAMYI